MIKMIIIVAIMLLLTKVLNKKKVFHEKSHDNVSLRWWGTGKVQ